jgi:hypothetical protein
MKIYLATWLFEKEQGRSLTKKRSINRLLSYFHTKQKSTEEFIHYLKFGR